MVYKRLSIHTSSVQASNILLLPLIRVHRNFYFLKNLTDYMPCFIQPRTLVPSVPQSSGMCPLPGAGVLQGWWDGPGCQVLPCQNSGKQLTFLVPSRPQPHSVLVMFLCFCVRNWYYAMVCN